MICTAFVDPWPLPRSYRSMVTASGDGGSSWVDRLDLTAGAHTLVIIAGQVRMAKSERRSLPRAWAYWRKCCAHMRKRRADSAVAIPISSTSSCRYWLATWADGPRDRAVDRPAAGGGEGGLGDGPRDHDGGTAGTGDAGLLVRSGHDRPAWPGAAMVADFRRGHMAGLHHAGDRAGLFGNPGPDAPHPVRNDRRAGSGLYSHRARQGAEPGE